MANDSPYWEGTEIYKVTADNFEEVVFKQEDFFLAVMEDDSEETRILLGFLELLYQRHKEVKVGLVLTRHNDLKKLKTLVFPSFLIYPRSKKHQPIFFQNEFDYHNVLSFYNKFFGTMIVMDEYFEREFLEKIKQTNPEQKQLIEEFAKEGNSEL